jgi:mono/diheme cytochrome c family protein
MTENTDMTTVNDIVKYVGGSDRWARHNIAAAVVGWVQDTFAEWDGSTYNASAPVAKADILRHLETIDCAACHAPAGLIYNRDIWAKVPEWADEIDQALWEYQDATGEPYTAPGDGTLTVGVLVWFAVEWVAGEIALELRNEWDM